MYKWDEMTARERDALVAEKVMGWSKVQEFDTIGTQFDVDGNEFHRRIAGYDFSPSSRISAAWEVLNKFGYYTVSRCDNYFVVSIDDPEYEIDSTSQDFCTAVCFAALETVRIHFE